ncbi:hypothetical protein [Paenibacillus sp.]|uniref:hypothetical protein n=1 Tax=Paenibacillus sp. TaxID=58172 RepID=UPI002D6FA159|nr:hypothetical protein [Paenibacillus sp.]HZG87293.1 hypothetical protein [Paenibacillus sp.]
MSARTYDRITVYYVEGDTDFGICLDESDVEELLAARWERADKTGPMWKPPTVYIGFFTGARDDDHVYSGWFSYGDSVYPVVDSIPDLNFAIHRKPGG